MNLAAEMAEAERKAWDSLSRYKFAMFGYWAAIWVHLNHISGKKAPNPFKAAVMLAREQREIAADEAAERQLAEGERAVDQILDERERTGL